jgi:hypothetical protein
MPACSIAGWACSISAELMQSAAPGTTAILLAPLFSSTMINAAPVAAVSLR